MGRHLRPRLVQKLASRSVSKKSVHSRIYDTNRLSMRMETYAIRLQQSASYSFVIITRTFGPAWTQNTDVQTKDANTRTTTHPSNLPHDTCCVSEPTSVSLPFYSCTCRLTANTIFCTYLVYYYSNKYTLNQAARSKILSKLIFFASCV